MFGGFVEAKESELCFSFFGGMPGFSPWLVDVFPPQLE